jgi:aldose 1-epimerase
MQEMVHRIASEGWQIGILPATGGAIAYGRIRHGERWLDFFRPTAESDYGNVSKCACFPLIPYSNRIRDRRFRFRGETFELRASKPDGTVMHGVGRNLPWRVASADESHIALVLPTVDHDGINFPFRFTARLEYRVRGAQFSIDTTITNDDTRAMPAGFGHHPYFLRHLSGADDAVSLLIPFDEYFELDKGSLPMGAPQPIPPRLDFRTLRPLASTTPDDNLTSRRDGQPVQMVYAESKQQITMQFDPVYANLVFYAPEGAPDFAVEPVTNANDGFNLYADGVRNSGVFVLEPGASRSGRVAFDVDRSG